MVCTIHILMSHRQRERSRLILWHMKEGRWPFGFDYRWAGLSVFARKKTVSAKTSRLKLQRAGPASRAVNERTDHCWFWTSRLCFVFALHKNTIVCHRYIIAAAFALHQNMIWCNSSSDTVCGGQRVDSQHSQGGVDWIMKGIYSLQWQQQHQETNELIYHPTAHLKHHQTSQDWQRLNLHPDGKRLSAASGLDFPVVWKLNCSVISLGRPCPERGALWKLACWRFHATVTLFTRCPGGVSQRILLTLVVHVPVTLRVAVVRRHSPPAICPWYYSRMR